MKKNNIYVLALLATIAMFVSTIWGMEKKEETASFPYRKVKTKKPYNPYIYAREEPLDTIQIPTDSWKKILEKHKKILNKKNEERAKDTLELKLSDHDIVDFIPKDTDPLIIHAYIKTSHYTVYTSQINDMLEILKEENLSFDAKKIIVSELEDALQALISDTENINQIFENLKNKNDEESYDYLKKNNFLRQFKFTPETFEKKEKTQATIVKNIVDGITKPRQEIQKSKQIEKEKIQKQEEALQKKCDAQGCTITFCYRRITQKLFLTGMDALKDSVQIPFACYKKYFSNNKKTVENNAITINPDAAIEPYTDETIFEEQS